MLRMAAASLILALFCGGTCPAGEPTPVTVSKGTEIETYKTVGNTELKIYILPARTDVMPRKTGVVFFFGGGWNVGRPNADFWINKLVKSGYRVFCPDYRIKTRDNSTPVDSMADGIDAFQWVVDNAARFGLDPDKIAAAGFSAGGHLAAATALFGKGRKPCALILRSPVLDTTPTGYLGNFKELLSGKTGLEISPLHHLEKGFPPTLIMHGDADTCVPFSGSQQFADKLKTLGSPCLLIPIPNGNHMTLSLKDYDDHSGEIEGFLSKYAP